MATLNSARGFTKIEIMVVLLVGMLVLAMIPPVCRRAKSDAARETCRANLAAIGRAMILYANDYEGKLPRSGGWGTTWGKTLQWDAPNRYRAFGMANTGEGGSASISSCFYLLIKHAEIHPRYFVCPGDAGTTEFRPADSRNLSKEIELIDVWDFGPESGMHCSYAYHLPFSQYDLSLSSDPHMPVAADRYPWVSGPSGKPEPFALFKPDLVKARKPSQTARRGNSLSHKRDGQNVLFVDGRVLFENRSSCGLGDDNIYTVSSFPDRGAALGIQPVYGFSRPMNKRDSLLVHDPGPFRTATVHQAREVDSRSLKRTAVVATLDCPLPERKNAIWCSTFQMAWDKFKSDVIGEPIEVVGAEDLTNRLNRTAFPTTDIEPQSYYANAGLVKNGIIEQIQKDMAQRFPSEPVPAFGDRHR